MRNKDFIKNQVIELAQSTSLGNREIARQLQIDEGTVRRWTKGIARPDTREICRNGKRFLVSAKSTNKFCKKTIVGHYVEGREEELEELFTLQLVNDGRSVLRQVVCEAGKADIVTDNTIYEIKSFLTLSNFKDAIGQVLVYRECINPQANTAIISWGSEIAHLHYIAENLNVSVIIFNENTELPNFEIFRQAASQFLFF
jgi:hypothetical protein